MLSVSSLLRTKFYRINSLRMNKKKEKNWNIYFFQDKRSILRTREAMYTVHRSYATCRERRKVMQNTFFFKFYAFL